SENGAAPDVAVTVNPSSEKTLRIDSFDPGASRVIIKVKTRSGRITAYLLDERVKGLNNVGGDFVAPINQSSREAIISRRRFCSSDKSELARSNHLSVACEVWKRQFSETSLTFDDNWKSGCYS
ncbi:MAG: hypothetical protein RLZZ19_964, partial [Actinomycetota bacterium]